MAKLAASTNAQLRYLLPFLVFPLPLRLPLLIFSLPTHRQYEAKLPTLGNRRISPVSSMIVSASVCPIPHPLTVAALDYRTRLHLVDYAQWLKLNNAHADAGKKTIQKKSLARWCGAP